MLLGNNAHGTHTLQGGIIATFNLRGTRLSFMTAHLEAHEGIAHYNGRNAMIAQILANARTDPAYGLQDASVISHHMFVCGDLNYRIRFGSGGEDAAGGESSRRAPRKRLTMTKRPTAKPSKGERAGDGDNDGVVVEEVRGAANGSHFAQAKALVDAEDWGALNGGDELTMALERKECLVGFRTLPCRFPPTFKVARGEGYQYNEKRTPR